MRSYRTARSLLPALLLLVGTTSATAQPVLELSLGGALDRALRLGPEAVLARRALAETAALRTGAGIPLPANPYLSGYASGYEYNQRATAAWQVRLDQTFEVGGQRPARLREVDRLTEASRMRAGGAIAELRSSVIVAYARAGAARARITFARQAVSLAERLLGAARLRVHSGAASDIEVSLAEVERGRAGLQLQDAERDERASQNQLLQYLDLAAGTRLALATPVGRLPEPAAVQVLLAHARRHRWDLRILRAEQWALTATDERLRREAIPNPTLGVAVENGATSPVSYGVVFGIPLPAWRYNQGERAVVAARRATMTEAVVLLERRIDREVTAAREEYVAREHQVESFENEVLPAAARTLDLVESGWLAGRFDLFRVLASSRELTEARRDYISLLGALWQSWAHLRQAAGED